MVDDCPSKKKLKNKILNKVGIQMPNTQISETFNVVKTRQTKEPTTLDIKSTMDRLSKNSTFKVKCKKLLLPN